MEICGGRRIVEGQKKMERPSEHPDPKIIGTGQDMYMPRGKRKKRFGRRTATAERSARRRAKETEEEGNLRRRQLALRAAALSKKRREQKLSSSGAGTSSWSHDVSSASTPNFQASDCGATTSRRNYVESLIKEEGVKEELILEDYGNPNDSIDYHSPEGQEGIKAMKEDAAMVHPSVRVGHFETMICGSGSVTVKQEVLEDESDAFSSLVEVEPIPPWSIPTDNESSEPHTTETAQCSLQTNFDSPNLSSKTNINVQHSVNKPLKQISKIKVKTSKELLKAVPDLGLGRCNICVNKVFSSPSDLMEHCILNHSDAPSRFSPAIESSRQHLFKATPTPGLSSTTIQDFSTANTLNYNATSTPSLSVANMSRQPPHSFTPPYISACDVFDGVFVSLRNIPEENRKLTKDKILEFVTLISNGNIDPALVSFLVMEK